MLMERDVEAIHAPLLVTNTKGRFVVSPRGRDGRSRYAFFECSVQEEAKILPLLYSTLLGLSHTPGYPTPKASLAEALAQVGTGSIILSESLVASVCGEGFTPKQVTALMHTQGHVATINGMTILAGPLPEKSALVVASPEELGVYTRVGDYLGLQLFDVRRTVVVVSLQ